MWWIVSFSLVQASFGKTIFLPMQKIPYVRQLPVDFSSLLCANGSMFDQNFSLSMQTFSGQLRACLCSTGGLSWCPGALHCCRAAARALRSRFSWDKGTPLTWISSVSPHPAPHPSWQHSCRQHKLHFIFAEMKPECALQGCSWHELQLLMGIQPVRAGKSYGSVRKAGMPTVWTPVCSISHFTLQPCSSLVCLSALPLNVNSTSGCSHLNHCNFIPPKNWTQALGCSELMG